MAAGNVGRWVDIKDITMMFSVTDIMGLNPFMCRILANAAAAVCGMAEVEVPIRRDDRPLVGVTTVGITTTGARHAVEVLEQAGVQKSVVSVVTRTEVSPEDPAFSKPTKPIGPFYTPQRAKRLMSERGYEMIEDAGRGWRRVVPSPKPLRIVELGTIADLVKSGVVVIASGGGGIPVVRTPEGQLTGVDAVIDKDLAGARLARDLNADILMIFTDVERVALNWGTPEQKWLADVSLAEMKGYETEGHFKAGSMKPKVAAAVEFVESGAGRRAVIGRLQSADKVLAGETGTWISA